MNARPFGLLLVPLAPLLDGCQGVTPDEPSDAASDERSIGSADDGSPDLLPRTSGSPSDEPPSGTNGKLPSCFWAHGSQQALRTLGAGAIGQPGGSIPSVSLALVPEGCRQVIQSAIECALPQGQTLSDPVTLGHYDGWWGLAPSWSDGALSTDGRRYVTACMLQRLNATGTPVPILLEGPAEVIAHDAALEAEYSVPESTAFGDLFSSTTPLFTGLPAFNAFVCWEDALPQLCGLSLSALLLDQRICDDAPLCGLTTVGPCGLTCAHNGPYWQCKPALLLLGPWWTQTVRVHLASETCQ